MAWQPLQGVKRFFFRAPVILFKHEASRVSNVRAVWGAFEEAFCSGPDNCFRLLAIPSSCLRKLLKLA